jgi:hypothetical protein
MLICLTLSACVDFSQSRVNEPIARAENTETGESYYDYNGAKYFVYGMMDEIIAKDGKEILVNI